MSVHTAESPVPAASTPSDPDAKDKNRPPRGFKKLLGGNRALSGGALLLVSNTLVNLGNYLYNLVLGRWLGPEAFADVSLIITLFLVFTLVAMTMQTVVARFAATESVGETPGPRLAGLRSYTVRWAWIIGIAAGLTVIVGAPAWQAFFHTQSYWPFVILGVAIPAYFAQAVDRGMLQGMMRFGLLALSYQAEMWTRLASGITLVALGFFINGAVASLSISIFAMWLVSLQVTRYLTGKGEWGAERRQATIAYAAPVAVAMIGQIVINNSDVLLVKHFFPAAEAGQYAALALIGRIVFFATWSVVTVLLPSVAQRQHQGQPHRHLLWLSLALVLGASLVVSGGAFFFNQLIVNMLFGPAYLSVAPLLWMYALATTLFAAANVFITYRLSLGQHVGSWLALAAGVLQVIGIIFFHRSLQEVVVVQIVIMTGLVLVMTLYELVIQRREMAHKPA